jgi:uncharacterized protein YaiE (UPF0345 family)
MSVIGGALEVLRAMSAIDWKEMVAEVIAGK